MDIAMQGTQGFNPNKDGYKVSSLPDKEFSGKQILAWFFVSWSMAMPDAVDSLGLNFHEEYKMAKLLSENK